MTKNYDVLKENNLRQMVAEYEQEQRILSEKRAKYEQGRRDSMERAALRELEDIRETEFLKSEPENYVNFELLMWQYTMHVYDNAWANLVRRYAAVHDAKNIDEYPDPTPLPRMADVMNPYGWGNYERLKELAARCHKWRQK